ncbi:MAG: hypothetical protein IPN25_12560 [Sphingobacteriales bacterium]|nr:hypothetical protein [Sphingobacteriales bacterium]
MVNPNNISPTLINEEEINATFNVLLHELRLTFGKNLDLQGLLFLVGLQELGQLHRKFEKEEKQDLMHIAVCTLLSLDGYFELTHRDQDGWTHFRPSKPLPNKLKNLNSEQLLLQTYLLRYFNKMPEKL